MLASQGLSLLMYHHDGDALLPLLTEDFFKAKIPITLFQILLRILQSQSDKTGSWGRNGSREETAYAVIALANLASLQFVQLIRAQIDAAVTRGRHYLLSTSAANIQKLDDKDCIWVGTVAYAVETVCLSYVLSALHIPIPFFSFSSKIEALLPRIPLDRVNSFATFYSQLRMFKSIESWQLVAYLIEGYLFVPELINLRLNLFDRKGMKKDSYFEYIPFSWAASNNMGQLYWSAQTLFDMMITVLISFQIDEFFDIIVQNHDVSSLANVRIGIDKIFHSFDDVSRSHFDDEILNQLSKFVHFVLQYPRIPNASENDRLQLRRELKIYLLAHIQQCEDNFHLEKQKSVATFDAPRSSFLRWVRTTGSDHFSPQYAFAFMTCLVGSKYGSVTDFFPTAEIKYIAQDCVTHLTVIGRIYNDSGSLRRDREEKNLNSTFFPEFRGRDGQTDAQMKCELNRIGQYEKNCFRMSFNELRRIANELVNQTRGKQMHEMVRLFYSVNEMYTEIYELKDISTSK